VRKHLGKVQQPNEASTEQSSSSIEFVPERVREFRNFGRNVSSGDLIGANIFAVGDYIDAIGITKGRGFEGVVRRHAFRGGDSTHGAKGWHRRSGAIGQRLFPGTVMRGMKMPGHMGRVRRTIQNLEVVQVRENENLLLIAGAIPGANGDYVIVRESVKKSVLRMRAKKEASGDGVITSRGKAATTGASKASVKKS
jgi:large subunit ribosomal protein L3